MSAKRGNGEGSIRRRGDGRWEGRLTLPDGGTKSLYGKTRADVARRLGEALRAREQGLPAVPERQNLTQYLTAWLAGIKPSVEPKTYRGYESASRVHLAPALGRVRLAQLTPQHLQALYVRKLEQGLAPNTVRGMHAVIRKALADALRMGLVQRNVALLVKAPRAGKRDMHVFTPEQVRAFLAAARGDRLEALYVLALSTGMREGELFGLRWRDVDLDGRVLQVQVQLKEAGGGRRAIGKTKTEASRRKILLTTAAIEALRAHRARQLEERLVAGPAWADHGVIFCNAVGGPLDPTKVTRYRYGPLLKAAGVPRIRFHDLRHTAATLLLLQGVPVKVVSEMLGHADVAITLRVYAHVLPDMQGAAVAAMERLLGAPIAAQDG